MSTMERRASPPAEERQDDAHAIAGGTPTLQFENWRTLMSGLFRIIATVSLTTLALGLAGCCSGMTAETVSTAKGTWQGKIGTAVTITQSKGTKEIESAKYVGFEFCQWGRSGEFWEIADFNVPVMKLEPKAVTLFFSTDPQDASMLEHIPSEFRAGRVRIVRCLAIRDC